MHIKIIYIKKALKKQNAAASGICKILYNFLIPISPSVKINKFLLYSNKQIFLIMVLYTQTFFTHYIIMLERSLAVSSSSLYFV